MFFEENDKDTSRNMDDHDLDFEGEDSVSWDKLLEETDAQQPQAVAPQMPDDLSISNDESFDDLMVEDPLNINEGEYVKSSGAEAATDEYTFDSVAEEPGDMYNFASEPEYEQSAAFEDQHEDPLQYSEPQGVEFQSAPTYQAPVPEEEYDTLGYDYDEETTDSQEPQSHQPERKIPGGSLAQDSPKDAPKKSNATAFGILTALLFVAALVLIFVLFGKDLIPGLAGASTGDADELLNTESQVAQDVSPDSGAVAPTDDPMTPPAESAQAPAANVPAPDVNVAKATETPGVSKKIGDKGAAKDPKTAKAEPGRGKVVLPVVNTGRANPFTPIVKYNSLGFITKPNMIIPEPPTDLGNLTEVLDKLQKIIVSGILYDSVKPSAIVKVSGVDYFVQKGDKVDSYVVADITQTTVTLKEGGNIYRASIGQTFSSAGAIGGQINVGNTKQRQYVSANDIGVDIVNP